jgi:hypothetical protein
VKINGDEISWKVFKEITKFKLSQLSTMGSLVAYLIHAPSIGLIESALFLTAT